jgi:hypothetical protein
VNFSLATMKAIIIKLVQRKKKVLNFNSQ